LLVYFVGMIVVIPLANVAALRASLMDDLRAAIGFKAVRAMTRILLKDILVGSFVMTLVTMPLAMLGLALCYVGVFPAIVIISVMHTYFHAELYKIYLRKGGVPLAIGAIDVGPRALAVG
ncbi:MAG: hypothetical protein K8H88_09725, partial [Sandaracinaceae bacterium]|nr:hypothetical protein [Sandaracinaceae bacterium]